MKLSVFLMLIGMMQVSANVYSEVGKINVQVNQIALSELLWELQDNSGIVFVYKTKDLMDFPKVSIEKEDASITEILDEILLDTDLEYTLDNNVVVIKKKLPESIPNKQVEIRIEEQEQEQKEIKGKVIDKEGNTLPGVSVVIKGTSKGVATNIDGEYTINFEGDNVLLVYSFVGMVSKEITYTGQAVQNVTLATDTEQMDEVVVYGSGLTKISKERATGSYSVMTRSDILASPNEEIGNSLEGTITGLQTNYNASTGESEIAIRGINSMRTSKSPLIVVDGFPVQGDFSTINPNDIETITVLKDAAAGSIWGAMAGNGVIVITTRKAESGKLNVEFGSYIKIGEEFDMDYNVARASVDNQLAYEKFMVDNGYGTKNGLPTNMRNSRFNYSKGTQAYYDHSRGALTDSELATTIAELRSVDYKDDVSEYMLQRPVTQQHNLAISGSTEKATYNLSVLYNDVKGHFKESENQKLLINFRNSYQVKDWLNFNFSIMSEIKKNDKSGGDINMLKGIDPYEKLINADGSYAQVNKDFNWAYLNPIIQNSTGLIEGDRGIYTNWAYNPLEEIRNREFLSNYNNTRIQTGLDIEIIEGLHFTPKFQYERFSTENSSHWKEETYYARNTVNTHVDYDRNNKIVNEVYVPRGGILQKGFVVQNNYNVRNQLNYDKQLGDMHEINLVAATELTWKTSESSGTRRYGYNADDNSFGNLPYGNGSNKVKWTPIYKNWAQIPTGNTLGYGSTRMFSVFANAAYTYNKKYTLTGSYRTDAANMIVKDPEYRYSPFWSVGASWNAKRENFLKDNKIVDKLSVRATYGVSGNFGGTASQVPVLQMYANQSTRTGAYYARVTDKGNPSLRWESVKQFNMAVDFSLFNRKLYGSVEGYNKHSVDILALVATAPTLGSNAMQYNAAELSNKGVEINLNSDIKLTNDFLWRTGANFSYNDSEVLSFKANTMPPRSIGDYRYVEGDAVAPVYSWVAGPLTDTNTATMISQDELGDTISLNANVPWDGGEKMLKNMGSLIAPTVVGWTNSFTFKGITLKAVMLGKFGHVFRRNTLNYAMSQRNKEFYHEDLNAVMEGRADEVGIPPFPDQFDSRIYYYDYYVKHLNTLVEDASHIRLKELYLGYDLPSNITKSIGIDNLRIYAHARNLGTLWTANDKGIDPEYIKGSRIMPGATYTFGFNLGF